MGREPQKDVVTVDSSEENQADVSISEIDAGAVEVEELSDLDTETARDDKADPGEPIKEDPATGAPLEDAAADEPQKDKQRHDTAASSDAVEPPVDKIPLDKSVASTGPEKTTPAADDNRGGKKEKDNPENGERKVHSPGSDTARNAGKQDSPTKQPDTPEKIAAENENDIEQRTSGETPAPPKRKLRLNYIIAGVLGALTIGGYILYPRLSVVREKRSKPAAASKISPTSTPATKLRESTPKPTPSGKEQKLQVAINEAIQLHSRLLDKKEEIYQLKLHYRHAIPGMLQWIEKEVKKEKISTFGQAVGDKQIEFKLRTIQRRQAYIDELEKPYHWIDYGAERLLFLIRRARFDILMLDVAAGIDLDRHRRHLEAAVQKYQPTAEKLAVEPPDDNPAALKSTWNKIIRHKSAVESSPAHAQDLEITDELCSGRYQRLSQLSEVSVKAARCLSRMKGTALILNNLPELSESAAKHLFKWRGDWICLNDLRTISPQVARYLFQWPGKWISLNGLSDFTPKVAEELLRNAAQECLEHIEEKGGNGKFTRKE